MQVAWSFRFSLELQRFFEHRDGFVRTVCCGFSSDPSLFILCGLSPYDKREGGLLIQALSRCRRSGV
jgi:hypothetical protein